MASARAFPSGIAAFALAVTIACTASGTTISTPVPTPTTTATPVPTPMLVPTPTPVPTAVTSIAEAVRDCISNALGKEVAGHLRVQPDGSISFQEGFQPSPEQMPAMLKCAAEIAKASNLTEDALTRLLAPSAAQAGAGPSAGQAGDAAAFAKCVAGAAGQKVADALVLDGGGISFKGGFNPATLDQAQIGAIAKCAEAGAAGGDAKLPPGAIPPLPGSQPPLAGVAQGDAAAFKQCITQALGPAIGGAVTIVNGSITFGQGLNPATLAPEQMNVIIACGQKLAGGAAVPSGQPPGGQTQPPAVAVPTRPAQPPIAALPTQPAQPSTAGDQSLFQQCVAGFAGPEIAAAVKIVDGNLTFADGLSTNSLNPQVTAIILACARQFAAAGTAPAATPAPPVAQPPAGQVPPGLFPPALTPTALTPPGFPPTGPVVQAPADPKQAAFQQCVTAAVGAQAAASISIQNGQLTFGPGLSPTSITPQNLDAIQVCGDKSGLLVLGSGPATSPGDMPQFAARSPREQEFWDCLKATHKELSVPALRLTEGGLPDFSISGAFPLSVKDFQTAIDCVPVIGPALFARRLSQDERTKVETAANIASKSVVVLETEAGAAGTGFFISKTGLIMTNYHVVAASDSFTVWLKDGRKFTGHALKGGPVTPDVGLVKVDNPPSDISPLPFGSTSGLKRGQTLLAIGHPSGYGFWLTSAGQYLESEKTKFTPVKSLDPEQKTVEIVNLINTVPGSAGSSGGPLLDLEGRVVGVVYGGTARLPIKPGGAPVPSSPDVREYAVMTQYSQAVPIEDALHIAADMTKDEILRPATRATPSNIKPDLTPAAQACVTGVMGDPGKAFRLTEGGGLPDFSAVGSASLSPSQFQAVIDCIPGLILNPSPETLVKADRKPQFPDDIRAKTEAVAAKARASVVFLDLSKEGVASGFIISKDGLVLTNNHNVEGALGANVVVWLVDGRSFKASIVNRVKQPDIALLKIENPPADLVPVTTGTSLDLKPDQPLVVVGNPGGMGNWIATLGSFVAVNPAIDISGNPVRELIATTPSMKGSSGSPVFNLDGQVVGVIWGGEDPVEKRQPSDPPKPDSSGVREYLVVDDLALSVGIEEAMKLVKAWTGQ